MGGLLFLRPIYSAFLSLFNQFFASYIRLSITNNKLGNFTRFYILGSTNNGKQAKHTSFTHCLNLRTGRKDSEFAVRL